MNANLFNRKIVLITGGASGIGFEIARFYANAGAKVIIADIQPANQEFEFEFAHADVSSPTSIVSLFEYLNATQPRLDVLINNAGISTFAPFEEFTLNMWDKVINTNLRSVFLCAQSALTLMKTQGGKIINIASTRAVMSEQDTEAYTASKGGVVAITHALAVSLSKYRIQVNCISPGWIDTGLYHSLSDADHAQHPSGRVGKPSDIARACLFLTSPDNEFVNGANLIVDGGMTIKMIYVE